MTEESERGKEGVVRNTERLKFIFTSGNPFTKFPFTVLCWAGLIILFYLPADTLQVIGALEKVHQAPAEEK
ncbi:MAG: hypothetical protein WBQ95_04375 [Terracidiphilus sp.]